MPRPVPGRRHRSVALTLASTALAGAFAAAPAAVAGSYEQVTRASGAQGSSPFDSWVAQGGASDTGRFALYTSGPVFPPLQTLQVRDIVANTTRSYATNVSRIFGADRLESKVLILRRVTSTADSDQQLVLVSTLTGAAKVLATFDDMSTVDAAISGDGNTIAISESSYATGDAVASTKLVNLRTKAETPVPTGLKAIRFSERSLSDDGKVLAGIVDLDYGFYFARGQYVETPENTVVSPNGAVIAYSHATGPGQPPSEVQVKRLATGQVRAYPYPAGAGRGAIAWIAPDASRIAISADREANAPARAVTLATGAWSTFGGPYARSLEWPITDSLTTPAATISRNGKYALIDYAQGNGNGQAAIVDLAGGDLPGSQEQLSASSYVRVSPLLAFCGLPSQVYFTYGKADAAWLPAPKKARLEAFVDGVKVVDETYDSLEPAPDEESVFAPVPIAAGAKKVTYRATVVDGFGKTLRDTTTSDVNCLGGATPPEPEPEG